MMNVINKLINSPKIIYVFLKFIIDTFIYLPSLFLFSFLYFFRKKTDFSFAESMILVHTKNKKVMCFVAKTLRRYFLFSILPYLLELI